MALMGPDVGAMAVGRWYSIGLLPGPWLRRSGPRLIMAWRRGRRGVRSLLAEAGGLALGGVGGAQRWRSACRRLGGCRSRRLHKVADQALGRQEDRVFDVFMDLLRAGAGRTAVRAGGDARPAAMPDNGRMLGTRPLADWVRRVARAGAAAG